MNLNLDCFDIQDNYEINKTVETKLMFGKRQDRVLLTICIPTHRRLVSLKETLSRALNQKTDYLYEIIVVDNDEEIDENKITDIKNSFPANSFSYYKNMNPMYDALGNWNRCMELARSKWLLLLHDDDLIECNYVQEMMDVVETSQNEWDALGCLNRNINEKSQIIGNYHKAKSKKVVKLHPIEWYIGMPIPSAGFLVKKSCAIALGGYDSRWRSVADRAFLINCMKRFRVGRYNQYLVRYRMDGNSSSAQDSVMGLAIMGCATMTRSLYSHYRIIPKWFHRLALIESVHQLEVACHKVWNTSWESMDEVNRYLQIPKGPLTGGTLCLFKFGQKLLSLCIKLYHFKHASFIQGN